MRIPVLAALLVAAPIAAAAPPDDGMRWNLEDKPPLARARIQAAQLANQLDALAARARALSNTIDQLKAGDGTPAVDRDRHTTSRRQWLRPVMRHVAAHWQPPARVPPGALARIQVRLSHNGQVAVARVITRHPTAYTRSVRAAFLAASPLPAAAPGRFTLSIRPKHLGYPASKR